LVAKLKNGTALRTLKTQEPVEIITDGTFVSTKEMSQHQLERVTGVDHRKTLVHLTNPIDSYFGMVRKKDGV
jgi:hypothetical protein